MTSPISIPPLNSALPLDDDAKAARWPTPWGNWMTRAGNILLAVSESGTTANRPVSGLYPGRMYFDISLGANGKPIWMNKGMTGWVLADGTAA